MKSIYILGASGFAKEVFGILKSLNQYEVVAFVDKEKQDPIILFNHEIPVISEEDFLTKEDPSSALLVMGIGDPKIINRLSEKFKHFDFPNIIHPAAVLEPTEIKLGRGNIIAAGVIFTVNCEVEDFNIFNLSVTIGHDCHLGKCNVINPAVNISGHVIIGDSNLIGVGTVILQNKCIGNNSIIGASSLITKDVADNTVVMGVPAKIRE